MSRGRAPLSLSLSLSLLFVFALSAACGSERRWVESPPGTVGGSMIFNLEGGATVLPPVAAEFGRRVEFTLDDGTPDDARLVARVFADSLDALDLAPGAVRVTNSGGRELAHEAGYTRLLSADGAEAWTPSTLATLSVEVVETPCPSLEVIQQPLETSGELGFALALDGARVWVGVRDGTLWEVSMDTVRRLDDFGPEVPRAVGHRGPLGDFWLAGEGGRLFRAHVQTSSLSGSLIVDDPGLGLLQWLAGGRLETGGFEVFAKSQEGIVIRVRGGDDGAPARIDVVHRFDVPRSGRGGGIAWLGPGRAAVGSQWSGELVFLDEDEVSFERPPIEQSTGITAVVDLPPFGLLIGDTKGTVSAFADGWRSLGQSGIGLLVHVIAPSRDGFFAMGTLGQGSRYDPAGMRFCTSERVGQSTAYAAAVLDRHVVLVDTNPSAVRTFVRFLRR